MIPPVLTTARLTLGPASAAHAEAFIAFCATEDSRFIGGPAERRDAWEGAAIGAGLWALRGYGPFWVSAGGVPVGRVGAYFPDWREEPELAWVIYPAHQGRGYATEAARAARDWAGRVLGLPALVSLIDTGNAASIRVAEKLGARLEGPHQPNGGKPVMRWRHPSVPDGAAPAYEVAA
ncbi:MAG: GNAT family N-acetyltransferase [Paracoccaceae bacterium]